MKENAVNFAEGFFFFLFNATKATPAAREAEGGSSLPQIVPQKGSSWSNYHKVIFPAEKQQLQVAHRTTGATELRPP